MFGFKRDVKKEMNELWSEIYSLKTKLIKNDKWIDGFDERLAGFQDEIREIETNYGDCIHNLEKDLNTFKKEIKNKLIPTCNKMWNKQKLMEETQLKIIKVLNAMADKLDEETIKTIKNI